MIIDVGIKPNDVTLSWETLFSYNRKILDAQSDRYFFVPAPFELKVSGLPKTFQTKLPLYPDKPERGFREYIIEPKGNEKVASFWISHKDAEAMEINKVMRLMELFNIKVESKTDSGISASFVSESYEDVRKLKAQLIQWIPRGTEFACQVVMPDATVIEGFCENDCKKLKPDNVIQFERFGFIRVNEVADKLVAYYAHK
jgi:glutamyl-tRNA synthetase